MLFNSRFSKLFPEIHGLAVASCNISSPRPTTRTVKLCFAMQVFVKFCNSFSIGGYGPLYSFSNVINIAAKKVLRTILSLLAYALTGRSAENLYHTIIRHTTTKTKHDNFYSKILANLCIQNVVLSEFVFTLFRASFFILKLRGKYAKRYKQHCE